MIYAAIGGFVLGGSVTIIAVAVVQGMRRAASERNQERIDRAMAVYQADRLCRMRESGL